MSPVVIDGASLDVDAVTALARRCEPVRVDPGVVDAATADDPASAGLPAYGRTTGVGANRDLAVDAGDAGHGLRLWSSHAAASGPLIPDDAVAAMMVVRLNQICTGRTGVSPAVAHALRRAVEAGALPAVHRYGAVGTGDLTSLAELGLCLAGLRPWRDEGRGAPPPVGPAAGDGIGLLSSNALTLGMAALACHDLVELSRSSIVVTALSCLAAGTSTDAFSPLIWAQPPGATHNAVGVPLHPPTGGPWVAGVLARLVPGPGRRIQDPYPLRAAPAWHGPLVTALDTLLGSLGHELNRSTENPMFDRSTGRWLHHAGIVSTELTAQLDAVRAALVPAANGSLSRTRMLHQPEVTGLPAFLAVGPPGSSGTMVCEYSAAAAVAEIGQRALSGAFGWTSLSLGQEDGASFATQSALATGETAVAYRAVLAAELVVAARALRTWDLPVSGTHPETSAELGEIVTLVLDRLPADPADHDLGPDLQIAGDLLPALAARLVALASEDGDGAAAGARPSTGASRPPD